MKVGLGPGHIVLDGTQLPPFSGKTPIFSNGLTDRHELKFGTVAHSPLTLLTLPPHNVSDFFRIQDGGGRHFEKSDHTGSSF